MIHYQGLPITPASAALRAIDPGHAFVSYAHADQLPLAVSVCQSFAIDNGAFSAWRKGAPVVDWSGYYAWAADCKRIPSCDFAVIPDVIGGTEAENDALLAEWPLPTWFGAPVWHMQSSFDRLERLAADYPRVCLGSAGEFSTVGDAKWWARMGQIMRVLCDDEGRPRVKLHGLRMLNPAVFSRLPLSSADSTNIGRNVGIDSAWRTGNYLPPNKDARAQIMRSRIESFNAPPAWSFSLPEPETQGSLI